MTKSHFTKLPEIFKPVPDFPGYDIGDQGTARSYWKQNIGKRGPKGRMIPGSCFYSLENTVQKIMRPVKDKNGYLSVVLTKNRHHLRFRLSRLVLLAFVGPCPPGMMACHNSPNPSSCRLEDLRWDTPHENMLDCTRDGTRWDNKGVRHPLAKLTEAQVLEIRRLATQGWSQNELHLQFDIDRTAVNHIIHRRRWSHI